MKRYLKRLLRNKSIGFKLSCAFGAVILVPMLLLSFISYTVINARLIKDAQEKVNISLKTAWLEYYERGMQMKYGMLQAASAGLIKDAIKHNDRKMAKKIMKRLKDARPYIDFLSIVDKDRKVIARLNSELAGDTLEISSLVDKSLSSGEQQMSSEILTEDMLKKEGPEAHQKHLVPIVSPDPAGRYKKDGNMAERRALAVVVVTPVIDEKHNIVGAIVAGDILNNDSYIPDGMAGMMHGLNTTIAMDGLRIATNLKDSNNQTATGTILPEPVMSAIKQGKQVIGEWNMLGHEYIVAVDVIKDKKGNIIGSIDAGIPKSAILSAQRENQKVLLVITLAGLSMALASAVLVAYRITMPLKRIREQADAFASGDMQARVDIEWDKDTRNDIGILARTFNTMVEAVRKKGEEKEHYLTELAEKNKELGGLNEKLRGANEELEVSFEELQSQSEEVQSASEELRVLNEDMDRKNAELMEANRIIRMEEEYLSEAKDKLRLIYDTIRDYILLIDKDLTVLEANRCFIEGMKLSESYVIGRTLCHCFGIKDPSQECPAMAAPGSEADYAVAGVDEGTSGYCPVKRSIGSKTPVEMEMTVEGRILQWRSFPLNAEDRGADMAVVYIKDVTEERLLMQRLIRSDKLASVGELVSGVAHELNNPLTSVMGFSELLLRDNIGEDVKKKVNYIHESSLRCKHIIDNLLTFSRWRKPDRVYQDVNSMIKGVVELKSYHIRVSNINVELDLDPSLPWTMADGYQLQQVFLNILNNAQHAIEEKGREGKIIISSRCKDDKLVISFSDTGGGIPKNIVGRIFDPFFTTKEVGKGTGLGLSISYGIIREHGGDIRVESSPDVGTTFVIELPVITATDKGQAMKSAATVHDTAVLKGLRALILDDEPDILDLLNEVLAGDGFHVEATSEGHKAIGMIKENDYNVIISDLKMPGMGGKEFYEAVKSIRPEAARRIIFISGDTASKETQEFLARCGNPFLQKPFDIEKLKEVILKIIS